jgi:hypothetical protein
MELHVCRNECGFYEFYLLYVFSVNFKYFTLKHVSCLFLHLRAVLQA